jgi:F0F1-type ATP synthase assembly protein I
MDESGRKEPVRARRNAALELAFTVGPTMVAGVLAGWWVGSAIDRWLSSSPVALAIGVILGAAAGFVHLVTIAKRLE